MIVSLFSLTTAAGAETDETGAHGSNPDPAVLHMAAGFGSGLIAGGLSSIWIRPWEGCNRAWHVASVAIGASAALGVAKESMDLLGFGTPSVADIGWTLLGGITAATAVTWIMTNHANDSTAPTMGSGTALAGFLVTIPVQINLYHRLFPTDSQ